MTKLTTFLALALAAGLVLAQDGAPQGSPAWTGVDHPMDVIAARQALMLAAEDLMQPVDTYTVEPDTDTDTVQEAGETIAAMMLAVPHLFPPTTDLYDPDAEFPDTIAMPRIWQEFPTFYGLASAASAAATAVAESRNADQLRETSLGLRAACDACHTLYLRPYEPSGVTEEDLDFDFDSIFEK